MTAKRPKGKGLHFIRLIIVQAVPSEGGGPIGWYFGWFGCLNFNSPCFASFNGTDLCSAEISSSSSLQPLADAILDRLVHNADRLQLVGESQR